MPKINFKKLDKDAIHIFNTKAEMLEYIKKSSFRKDEYCHYEMRIQYRNKKWIVWWE